MDSNSRVSQATYFHLRYRQLHLKEQGRVQRKVPLVKNLVSGFHSNKLFNLATKQAKRYILFSSSRFINVEKSLKLSATCNEAVQSNT